MKDSVKIGLIGAGFIGRAHGLAIRAVNGVFTDLPVRASAEILCDVDLQRAVAAADAMGFSQATDDWKKAVDEADAVIIAVPSRFHSVIAERAIAQGKPFLCEKPVGLSSQDAQKLADSAARAKIVTAVGFTYVRAPMVAYARQVLDSGRLGKPVHFYGRHFEDYLASPQAPFSWRLDRSVAGPCGALGDLGCHIIAIARYLCGPVQALSGTSAIIHAERPTGDSAAPMRKVENEDYASALLRFESGIPGIVETSRVAHGRKMDLSFELTCERGSIRFEAERFNEIEIYLADEGGSGGQGFRRILINADHPDYAAFLPAPGHGLGFNDLKTIELAAFLRGITAGRNVYPDMSEAASIFRICEAILNSSETGSWVENPESSPLRK